MLAIRKLGKKMGRPTGIEPYFAGEAKSLENADLVDG
jgi:hypothetical protein